MSDSAPKAVFLSYASQDAAAAKRVCEALRAAGIEVWFDQNELVGGDAWDAKIRKQIAECALFVPVISANTQARREGYFRLEWRIAAQRTHMMSEQVAFLLPVVVDATRDAEADVPAEFKAVQWTRLPAGETPPAFCARVAKLLAGDAPETSAPRAAAAPRNSPPPSSTSTTRRSWLAPIAVGAAVVALGGAGLWFVSRRPAAVPATREPAAAPTSAPAVVADAKSIAVLPFENLSTEPDAAVFTEGMHEEMCTTLGLVSAFTKVINRTSVLRYRDPAQRDLRQIAADLEVGSVIEGSVRRMGSRVRIAVTLIDARTRRQIWAESFTKDSADLFSIQTDVAREVASRLQATLTPSEQSTLAQRPSTNARAYELYVEARSLRATAGRSREAWEQIVAKLEEATRLDPQFAGGFAQLSYTHSAIYFHSVDTAPARIALARAALDAAKRLAPGHGETALATGYFAYCCEADFPKALRHFEVALRWNPNDATVRGALGTTLRRLGRHVEGASELERAFALDPAQGASSYGQSLLMLRRYPEYLVLHERVQRTAGEFDRQLSQNRLIEARYEATGDRDQLLKDWAARATATLPEQRLSAEVNLCLARGDWSAALAQLTDDRVATAAESNRAGLYLTRARVAAVLGQRDLVVSSCKQARAASEAASRGRFAEITRLQVEVELAALLGRREESQRAAEALERLAQEDRFVAVYSYYRIATACLILGDREGALKHLKTIMTGPGAMGHGPRSIRLDPFWSQLNGDPRFEEILRNAKRL